MIYEPDQLKVIMPYVREDAEWFLLGGPADANEAQMMRSLRPGMCILGCEPNPVMFNIQKARGFPGRLLQLALWNEATTLRLGTVDHQFGFMQEQRSASARKFPDSVHSYTVQSQTLDNLSVMYGPFRNAVLWIDIESAEYECLQGSTKLLTDRQIHAINVETFVQDEPATTAFLKQFGFKEALRWNHDIDKVGNREWWNAIYVLD